MSDWRKNDRLIATHEAAHAVTAEVVAPGSVLYIQMDAFDQAVDNRELGTTAAFVQWRHHMPRKLAHVAAVIYASKWAEERMGWYDHNETCGGDFQQAKRLIPSAIHRRSGSKLAKKIVKEHWDLIERIADEVQDRRYLGGPFLRSLINGA